MASWRDLMLRAGPRTLFLLPMKSPKAHAALIRGSIDAIINQDAGHEVRSAVRVLISKADNVPFVEAQERIRIDIFMRDNLP